MDDTQLNQKPGQDTDQQPEPPKSNGPSPTVNPSYQRSKPFVITDKVRQDIKDAFASIDMERIRMLREMTLPQRVQLALSMIEDAEREAVKHLRQNEPDLSEEDALWVVRSGLPISVREKLPINSVILPIIFP